MLMKKILLQKMIDESQKTITGTVRIKLYKGNCIVMGRKAKKSLYDQNVVTFEEGEGYCQNDADGFIRVYQDIFKIRLALDKTIEHWNKRVLFLRLNKTTIEVIEEKNEHIVVGAATSLREFELFIKKYYPDFTAILKRYGSVQIRNVATIAGNIATASPIGDTLPLLLSLDAKVVLQGLNKKTILPLKFFFVNYRKTKLKKRQFIHSIIIPVLKKTWKLTTPIMSMAWGVARAYLFTG